MNPGALMGEIRIKAELGQAVLQRKALSYLLLDTP